MDNELIIRVFAFGALLLIMLGWEALAPRRPVAAIHRVRQFNNLLLLVVDAVLLRLLVPVAAVGMALLAEDRGWGLFNLLDVDKTAALVLSVILLDVLIYGQHVLFHKVPLLWCIHRVHHTDPEFDVTTGVRFHPVEIILSMLIKMLAVIMIGAPVMAVIVFEILLNGVAMFNHGNVRLPPALDRRLRLFVVTPDMHRVHHSVLREETDSNYGFFLPVWDRLFGTYRDQPRKGHAQMQIGLSEFTTNESVPLMKLLVQPFRKSSLLQNS